MQTLSGAAHRPKLILAGVLLAVGLAVCHAPAAAFAQAGATVSPDPQVRATQQWEDVLLAEDFDYLQLTPQQCNDMQTLADYARTRMDEVDQLKLRLQKAVQDQHQSLLKGKRPTESEQMDILQKQRQVVDRQEAVSREIVDRLAPKLGGILTRKQTVRAWLLLQNKVPAAEPKRVALVDPPSGFVLPNMEGHDAVEEIVKTALRKTYPQDVLDQALTPWEFQSLAALGGAPGAAGGPAGPGGFGGGGGIGADRTKIVQAIQQMDPQMGQRMLMLGQRMLKQFLGAGGGDPNVPQPPPVAPEVRAAVNRDAAALRKSIENDPETFLSQAQSDQMLEALRPLARRLFLSPRLKEALAQRLVK